MPAEIITPRAESNGAPSEFSLLSILTLLIRHRRVILAAALVGFIVGGVRRWVMPRTYTSAVTFLPEARTGSVAMLGFPAGLGADPTQSPAFYANLATSDAVLRRVVESRIEWTEDGARQSGTLIERYGGSGDLQTRRQAAIATVAAMIEPSDRLGMVTLRVSADYAAIAQQIATKVVEALNNINVDRRRSLATREREFREQRVADARASLRAAEDRLRSFLDANREFHRSPRLQVHQQRLARDVELEQQAYIARMQAYEQARVDEVRDVPVLTILSTPEEPASADPRRITYHAMLGAIVAGMAAIVVVILLGILRRLAGDRSPEASEFFATVSAARGDLPRPLRRLTRTPAGD